VIDVAAIPWDGQWLREYEEEMYEEEEEDRQSQVGFIPPSEQKIGVIVVDHGSRRPEANKLLEKVTVWACYFVLSRRRGACILVGVEWGEFGADGGTATAQIVEDYKGVSGFDLVEPAHMELAEPSIAAGRSCPGRYERCESLTGR
jgi:hypothetical protein